MQSIKQQSGFTLIELVVVIVILGILAATAAPKFIDLQSDATASTIQAVKGSMESAAAMTHSKSLIVGNDQETGVQSIAINPNENVNIVNGWPTNEATDSWNILLELNDDEFLLVEDNRGAVGTEKILAYPTPADGNALSRAAVEATECYASYQETTSSFTKPVIEAITDGC